MAGYKTIIINASSVKYGGAATILNSFMDWIEKHDKHNRFLLFSAYCPPQLPDNVTIVDKHTSGLGTLWFATFGILLQVIKYRASCCISLSNINILLPITKRVTYFHQAKVFVDKSLRFRLMALAIHLIKGSTIVVQSPLIESRFKQKFGVHYEIMVKWPGLENCSPCLSKSTKEKLQIVGGKALLWPVTDPFLPQKNLEALLAYADWLEQHNITILITSDNKVEHPQFASIGRLTKADLVALYSKVDGVVIVSQEETVCLPIFEAAQQGANVFVLDRPYIRSLEQWRGLPENVSIIKSLTQVEVNKPRLAENKLADASYFESDWLIYSI